MLKSDLVTLLVEHRDLPQKQAEQVVDAVFQSMSDALSKGENIEIRGFGSFHVKDYKSYEGRNPSTKEKIKVASKKGILFRTSKKIVTALNVKEVNNMD